MLSMEYPGYSATQYRLRMGGLEAVIIAFIIVCLDAILAWFYLPGTEIWKRGVLSPVLLVFIVAVSRVSD